MFVNDVDNMGGENACKNRSLVDLDQSLRVFGEEETGRNRAVPYTQ